MTETLIENDVEREWVRRFDEARRHRRCADMLLLADEAPTAALQQQARRQTAELLLARQQPELALEQVDAALALLPQDASAHRLRALCVACLDGNGDARAEALRSPATGADAPRPQPRQVLLFSGHMVDAPGRASPRFPAHKVPQADAAIRAALASLEVSAGDLALTQGAAGGDLLFAEACVERGAALQLLLPLPVHEFVERSVRPSSGGSDWQRRFVDLCARLPAAQAPLALPEALGPAPDGVDLWERCNRWLLYHALVHGPRRLHLLCLWDGGGGDGPGGTAHMMREVQRRHGRVHWIDTRGL